MIAFVTLLLGIAFGVETLELRVGEGVDRVNLHLDGALVATLEEPPWKIEIDLGDRPEPHHLEAVALDQDGKELDRAEQWLNVPQSAAEASVVVDRLADGGALAKVAWESLAGAQPTRIEASFDGRPLAVTDAERIVLPPYDDGALHFLRIELVFSETVSSLIERTLGGTYTDSVITELTAVPITLDKPRRKLDAAVFQGLLAVADQPLEVVAVESGPKNVVMVVDRAVFHHLGKLIESRLNRTQRAAGPAWGSLRRRQRLRFLWPVTQRQMGASRAYDLFNLSETFDVSADGVYYLMRNVSRPLYVARGRQRLADAIANAALEAASRRRGRIVVLVLGDQPEDESTLRPDQVRAYLADLQVPLQVWTTDTEPRTTAWGQAIPIGDPFHFARAARQLGELLHRQRIVWVQGTHLPQTIWLTPAGLAQGMRIAR